MVPHRAQSSQKFAMDPSILNEDSAWMLSLRASAKEYGLPGRPSPLCDLETRALSHVHLSGKKPEHTLLAIICITPIVLIILVSEATPPPASIHSKPANLHTSNQKRERPDGSLTDPMAR